MRVLILGGNGFIGTAVASLLARRGHSVVALARPGSVRRDLQPGIERIEADIASLSTPADWRPLLAGVDALVNCAGALQDGARDDVTAVQLKAMKALYEAAPPLVVQISARTDGPASGTTFLATKRQADAALAVSGVPFVILRPAVVVGRNAHGGSALLRALAAFPLVTPLVHGDSRMQFVALDDVAQAVLDALDGVIAPGSDINLAAEGEATLAEAIASHRRWLGLPPAPAVAMPGFVAGAVSRLADLLGHLGWRSPLRSTALAAAAGGIAGHATLAGRRLATLDETLAANPAGVQDLWFARLYLLKPVLYGTLSLFWLVSGVVALARFDDSAAYLTAAGASPATAAVLTAVTGLLDIGLGFAVTVRGFAAPALVAMVAVSLAYLAAATVLVPGLWAEPLGPLVKVLPSMALALAALAIYEER
ncbi:SDR family oxidoreductase [Mesorhizobium sp. KR9-304]|uniref:SDR family oxidoreductase n=1 Tax=Mesorhizobium sp. KR9-304 TaxID=3156614 RepID=UPI0032B3B308